MEKTSVTVKVFDVIFQSEKLDGSEDGELHCLKDQQIAVLELFQPLQKLS